ncbi:Adenylyl/guanylyl cyclase, catalytic incomplete domain containing protein [Pandoravirus celtis]|uniref:Adenylyl/guanylyl cyclase, catalytic incomplete domain containing protein n=1 Tax=Pandoravirus celtis TaxID=2568002 RepID=A0A4D6EI86_9VIRU|nr:Adenylyl/guanylyl cyclase, catalytic incomplete domain containing protein [Pandoravirus celtis]
MRDATLLHNDLLRAIGRQHGAHEAALPRDSSAGTFCMAFAEPLRAASWCAAVQRQLLDVDWPSAVLACEPAAEVLGHDSSDRPIFRGLCVRMGMHVGRARAAVDRVTRRPEYRGTIVDETLRIVGRAQPGQVLLSAAAAAAVRDGPEPVRLARESCHRHRSDNDDDDDDKQDRDDGTGHRERGDGTRKARTRAMRARTTYTNCVHAGSKGVSLAASMATARARLARGRATMRARPAQPAPVAPI